MFARVSAAGARREWRLPAAWVRLERVDDEDYGPQSLTLVSRGRSWRIARDVGPDRKAEFAGDLTRALDGSAARSALFLSAMMNPRLRKALGAFAMLAFVLLYAFVAMALADSRPVNEASDALAHGDLCRARAALDVADDAAHRLDGARPPHATLSALDPRFHSRNGAPDSRTSR